MKYLLPFILIAWLFWPVAAVGQTAPADVLIAAQSGVALSLAITLRHLKAHGVVIDDDDDTPTDERVTLPGYVAKQETRE